MLSMPICPFSVEGEELNQMWLPFQFDFFQLYPSGTEAGIGLRFVLLRLEWILESSKEIITQNVAQICLVHTSIATLSFHATLLWGKRTKPN
jgi:hypothetical protein